jgi:hypothetical protein
MLSESLGGKEVKAMRYETPVLLVVGPASSLVLGVKEKDPVDRLPESDLRKGDDAEEGLDE